MARVSVSNEFFRQKERRQLMHEDSGDPNQQELEALRAKVEQMEATIRQSEQRNELLVQEMDALREKFTDRLEQASILERLNDFEEAFLKKCEETASAIKELRKEANLPEKEKMSTIPSRPQAAVQSQSLGIPWGAPNTRPWSSELESTALSIKESLLRKRLAPELGTKITIYDDQKDKATKDADHLFEILDDNLTSPLAKNSSLVKQSSPDCQNIENAPDLGAPHSRTRSKSPSKEPNGVKKEPVRRTRRRRRAPLSNITSKGNIESDDDDAVFDFVEQEDLLAQTNRRSKRRRAAS